MLNPHQHGLVFRFPASIGLKSEHILIDDGSLRREIYRCVSIDVQGRSESFSRGSNLAVIVAHCSYLSPWAESLIERHRGITVFGFDPAKASNHGITGFRWGGVSALV